mmetsp:Transcript_1318/g.1694  ORF Transcript_1318/g.1694 Transcript_1318/m.1694 type:complete len:314 (+) Transcript_1318:756-1697(+)
MTSSLLKFSNLNGWNIAHIDGLETSLLSETFTDQEGFFLGVVASNKHEEAARSEPSREALHELLVGVVLEEGSLLLLAERVVIENGLAKLKHHLVGLLEVSVLPVDQQLLLHLGELFLEGGVLHFDELGHGLLHEVEQRVIISIPGEADVVIEQIQAKAEISAVSHVLEFTKVLLCDVLPHVGEHASFNGLSKTIVSREDFAADDGLGSLELIVLLVPVLSGIVSLKEDGGLSMGFILRLDTELGGDEVVGRRQVDLLVLDLAVGLLHSFEEGIREGSDGVLSLEMSGFLVSCALERFRLEVHVAVDGVADHL